MPDRHTIILSALRAIADCITEQVKKLGQQTVEIEAKEAQQEEEKRQVLAQLTQELEAATRPHFPFSTASAKTPSSTEASPSPQCAQPQPPPDSDSTLPKPVRKRGGDWILAVHRVFSLCSQRGLPMPGESDLPDFHDPLLVPEQWVMEYEARLRAAASPNSVQTEFDSLNSLDARNDTTITTDFSDSKKSFDEVALARCAVMAMQSLSPDLFEAFVAVHNELIERRKLQNKTIRPGLPGRRID